MRQKNPEKNRERVLSVLLLCYGQNSPLKNINGIKEIMLRLWSNSKILNKFACVAFVFCYVPLFCAHKAWAFLWIFVIFFTLFGIVFLPGETFQSMLNIASFIGFKMWVLHYVAWLACLCF